MAIQKETIPENDPLSNPELKKKIDKVLEDNKDLPGATMVVLSEIQNQIGYISDPMQIYIGRKLHVPVSTVHGVVTFYSFFTTSPRGLHTLKFCMGTACYVGGAPQLIEKARQTLGIDVDQTTPDGAITMEICRCVGACSQAPAVVSDEDLIGRMTPSKVPQIIKKLQQN